MQISRFEIRDMRAIDELVLHPHPKRTILHGPGAGGKSTVIDALAVGVARDEPARKFAGSDRRNGTGRPSVLIRTRGGSAWSRHAMPDGQTETRIDIVRHADACAPTVVRTTTKRRKKPLPARTGGHPWWKAFDAAQGVLKQEGAGGIAREPERWSQSQHAVIGLFAAGAEALAHAYPDADPLLEQPLLMLVENIDEHLHPLHRQRIVPALGAAFPGLQLIATTNSAEVLTSVHPDELIELSWTKPRIDAEWKRTAGNEASPTE